MIPACTTCGGDPHSHPSGLLCICEDGTAASETVNLRMALQKEETDGAFRDKAHERQVHLLGIFCDHFDLPMGADNLEELIREKLGGTDGA